MKILKREEVYSGKFLKIIRKDILKSGKERGIWECAERKNCKGAVAIFALTDKKEVILEKIFRNPGECFVLELPAGLLDKKGESKKTAIKRELLEETGYKAEKITPIFSGPIHSSLTSYEITVFFSPNVKLVQKPKHEAPEEIEVVKVPLGKFVNYLINPPKNVKVDMKALGAFAILKNKGLI